MTPSTEKTLQESIAGLLGRAQNARGLEIADLEPRVAASVDKYIAKSNPGASRSEVREFIGGLNADDLCLIVACERGDEGAWDDLVKSFGSVVRSTARNFCSNNEDVEDLANSIWAELHGLKTDAAGKPAGKIAYYSGRGSLAGWLRAVVHQLAIDQHRKLSRFVQIEEDSEFENLVAEGGERSEAAHFMSVAVGPEDSLDEREAQRDVGEALRRAITDLEAEDRLIIKLYYFDNLRLKEIGQMLGFHEATASRRLMKIQSDLRKGVEKLLQNEKGWKIDEVQRFLAGTAEKMGIDLERMFAGLIVLALLQEGLQEMIGGGVL
jgi:RNA polymerase sigma-70 factor